MVARLSLFQTPMAEPSSLRINKPSVFIVSHPVVSIGFLADCYLVLIAGSGPLIETFNIEWDQRVTCAITTYVE